jgi:hypothetical protein
MKYGILVPLFLTMVSCATNKKKTDASPSEKSVVLESPAAVPAGPTNQLQTQKNELVELSPGKNKTLSCKRGSDVRTLIHMTASSEAVPTDKKKCQVVYRKFNKSDVVATANHQADYCIQVFERIKSKLESSGFQCENKADRT